MKTTKTTGRSMTDLMTGKLADLKMALERHQQNRQQALAQVDASMAQISAHQGAIQVLEQLLAAHAAVPDNGAQVMDLSEMAKQIAAAMGPACEIPVDEASS